MIIQRNNKIAFLNYQKIQLLMQIINKKILSNLYYYSITQHNYQNKSKSLISKKIMQNTQKSQNIQFIDLRSDVVSRSPPQMLKAMSQAKVGDDVFGDDPTAIQFQSKIASTFNQQAAIFFPSASMACLSCVIAHCRPGDQMIIWGNSHAVDRQCSSIPLFAGVLSRQIFTEDGTFQPELIQKMIKRKESQIAYPDTTFVFAQNPTYTGHVYPLDKWRKLKQVCKKKNVHLHIDGARIYHALANYKLKPVDVSDLYDSMTICLSKSLCCPTGAVVVGKKDFVTQLRFIRKALGGGMRQVGILCGAGIYALENLVPQVAKDNQIALLLGKELSEIPSVKVDFDSLQTNMVNFNFQEQNFNHDKYKQFLQQNKIKIKPYNDDLKFYRLVVYPQIREKQIEKFVQLTKQFLKM